MAGGGQRGLSFIGEASAVAIVLGFIGGCTARGWVDGQDDDPLSQHQTACEQAWSDRERGQAEDDDLVLLDTAFCQQHNAMATQEVTAENQEDLQEAQP